MFVYNRHPKFENDCKHIYVAYYILITHSNYIVTWVNHILLEQQYFVKA